MGSHTDTTEPLIRKTNPPNGINPESGSSVTSSPGRRVVTVEPCLFLGICAFVMNLSTSMQYLYVRVAEEEHYTGPKPGDGLIQECTVGNLSDPVYAGQQAVQRVSSLWYSGLYVFLCVPSFVSTVVLGGYSDRAGRKVALLLPTLGSLVSVYINICTNLFHLPKWLLLIGGAMDGLSGTMALFLTAAFSYIADVSTSEERSVRVVVLETVSSAAYFLASVGAGFLIEGLGFLASYLILMAMVVTNFVYIFYFLPDSVPKVKTDPEADSTPKVLDQTPATLPQGSSASPGTKPHNTSHRPLHQLWHYVQQPFHVYFRSGPGGRRPVLVLCLLIFMLYMTMYMGRSGAQLLFFFNYPFCWSSALVGLFGGVMLLSSALGSLALTRALHRRLADLTLLHCGVVSAVATVLTLANVTDTGLVFLGKSLTCWVSYCISG